MPNESAICTSALQCIYDFQTLIAAFFAGVAAIISGYAIWRAAKIPIEAQNKNALEMEMRKKNYVLRILCFDLRLVAERARQAEGNINAQIAANKEVTDNTRSKTTLAIHSMSEDWEFMSLLPADLLEEFMGLRREIEDHNFDMARAGGVFGDDNFRDGILARVNSVHHKAFGLANKFIGVTGDTRKT